MIVEMHLYLTLKLLASIYDIKVGDYDYPIELILSM
jgi:hypothetical protein